MRATLEGLGNVLADVPDVQPDKTYRDTLTDLSAREEDLCPFCGERTKDLAGRWHAPGYCGGE